MSVTEFKPRGRARPRGLINQQILPPGGGRPVPLRGPVTPPPGSCQSFMENIANYFSVSLLTSTRTKFRLPTSTYYFSVEAMDKLAPGASQTWGSGAPAPGIKSFIILTNTH